MSLSLHHAVPTPLPPSAGLLATLGVRAAPSTRTPLLSSSTHDPRWKAQRFEQPLAIQTRAAFLEAQTEARLDPVPDPQGASVLGMLRRGHGRDLIASALQVATSIVDSVAYAHGLTHVADRQFIARRYADAWTIEHYTTLARLWRSGVRALDIGEHLGRSRASIWSKRRYLGLPRRDRVYTRVPKAIELAGRQANDLLPLDDPKRILTIQDVKQH